MKSKSQIINIALIICLCLGAVLVLYMSWISSPKIGSSALVPNFIASWADTYRFQTIRTAIPLLVLGLVFGGFLILKKTKIVWWATAWLSLMALVVLAEIGQLWRPYRIFDKGDIKWGWLGASVGIFTMFVLRSLIKIIKK